jgi:hypothetical protein
MTCSTFQQEQSTTQPSLLVYPQATHSSPLSYNFCASPTRTSSSPPITTSMTPNMLPSIPRKRGRENTYNGGYIPHSNGNSTSSPLPTHLQLATSPRRISNSMHLSIPPLHSGYATTSIAPQAIHLSSLISSPSPSPSLSPSPSPYLHPQQQQQPHHHQSLNSHMHHPTLSPSATASPTYFSAFPSYPPPPSHPSTLVLPHQCTPPSAKKLRVNSLSPSAAAIGLSTIDVHVPSFSPMRQFASSPISSPTVSPSMSSYLDRRPKSFHEFLNSSDSHSPMPRRPFNLAPIHIPSPISRGSSPSLSVFSSSPPTSITPLSLPASASIPNSIDSFQALLPRFRIQRTLQQSLFGCIKVAEDRQTRQLVAIKISRRASTASTTQSSTPVSSLSPSSAPSNSITPRSASAPSLLKTVTKDKSITDMNKTSNSNVVVSADSASKAKVLSLSASLKVFHSTGESCRRESSLLKLIRDYDSPTILSTSNTTSSLAEIPLERATSRDSVTSSTHDLEQHEHERSLSVSPVNASQDSAKRHICSYITDLKDENHHYLVLEYAPYGDLQHYLSAVSKHRIDEPVASKLLFQLVSTIHSLHKVHHIAHLDLSLENICLSRGSDLKIIDFGLAVLHPLAAITSVTSISLSHPLATSDNTFETYKCAAYPRDFFPPGKPTYQSPEMYSHQPWDAFAADVFAIGVIAYTLLTGHPPFHAPVSSIPRSTKIEESSEPNTANTGTATQQQQQQAGETQHSIAGDPWYTVISSGAWLNDEIKSQSSASIYTHLSSAALSFIDIAIKPETSRATIDELLHHPFLQQSL